MRTSMSPWTIRRMEARGIRVVLLGLLAAFVVTSAPLAQGRVTVVGEIINSDIPGSGCTTLMRSYSGPSPTVLGIHGEVPEHLLTTWVRVTGLLREADTCSPWAEASLDDVTVTEAPSMDFGVGKLWVDMYDGCHSWRSERFGGYVIYSDQIPSSLDEGDQYRVVGRILSVSGLCGANTLGLLADSIELVTSPTLETSWGEIKRRYRGVDEPH